MCLIALLVGCNVVAHRGYYKGFGASAWVHSIPFGQGGTNYFELKKSKVVRGLITASTTVKGSIYVSIFCFPSEPPVFAEPDAIVEFPDGRKRLVKASDKMDIRGLEADSFRLKLPSFRLQGVEFPSLVADFVWDEETKYFVR